MTRITGYALTLWAAFALLATSPVNAQRGRSSTGIRVTSDPDGAEIFVNGVLVGETPTRTNVSPGRHELVMISDGVEHEVIVRVRAGHFTRVYHAFEREPGDDEGRERDDREDANDDRSDRDGRDDDWDEEVEEDEEDEEDAPQRFGRGGDDESGSGSWASRINRWPMIELQVLTAPIERTFKVPINDTVDTLRGRNQISFVSGWFGVMGFDVSVFPFAHFEARALRGLGLQARGAFGFLLEWGGLDNTLEPPDISYYAIDADLLYRLVVGGLDVGAEIELRVGYHREEFFLGDDNNDLVAPFTYDTVRFDLGVRIPLRTRHMLGVVRGAYLLVPSIGDPATVAYGEEGLEPTLHGAELRIGLVWRIGGLELSWTYIGRLFWSRFSGVGLGFGDEPTTVFGEGGNGIQLTDTAKDSYQQIRFAIGYRW